MDDLGIVISIKDLEDRYQLSRSNVYNRINSLKAKGYNLEPQKLGSRSFFSGDQVVILDRLHEHLRQGDDLKTFPDPDGRVVLARPIERPVECPVGHSPETTDGAIDRLSITLGIASLVEAIASKIVAINSEPAADQLANLRTLQEACDRGWLLSSSQLKALLCLKTLSGAVIQRYGFTFTRSGKNGSQSAWRISK